MHCEAALDPTAPKPTIENSYIDISHVSRGWNISAANARKVLNGFNQTYTVNLYNLFPINWLNDSDQIRLYLIGLDERIYHAGLRIVAFMYDEQLTAYLKQYGVFPTKSSDPQQQAQFVSSVIQDVTKLHDNFTIAMSNGDAKGLSKAGTKLF